MDLAEWYTDLQQVFAAVFIFVMTTKEEWLGKARLLLKNYEAQFAGFASYFQKNYQ